MPGEEGNGTEPAGRLALLDAAVRVVAREGLDGVSYRSVAEEAGTTAGLVFYHFGSRESLILEAAVRGGRRAAAHALPVGEDEDLDTFLDDLSTQAENDLADHVFQYEMAFNSRRRPDLAERMVELYAFYAEETERALRSLGISEVTPALARMVFAAIDGLVLQQVVFDDPARTDGGVRALRAGLRALLPP
jgi:AcrR family transcriptional regulator